MRSYSKSPILITGVQRSGASIVARILALCGVYTGDINKMYENKKLLKLSQELLLNQTVIESKPDVLFTQVKEIPVDWQEKISSIMPADEQWIFKSYLNTQLWKVWNYAYPNAKWVIVRRRSADIINSCQKTAYMTMFRDKQIQEFVGVNNEKEGWLWWIHKYENAWVDMISSGLNCKVVWPERMVTGDYAQMYELIEWLGLEWNSKIVSTIDPLLRNARR